VQFKYRTHILHYYLGISESMKPECISEDCHVIQSPKDSSPKLDKIDIHNTIIERR